MVVVEFRRLFLGMRGSSDRRRFSSIIISLFVDISEVRCVDRRYSVLRKGDENVCYVIR